MIKVISPDQEPEFVKRWESGELGADIAFAFGCSRKLVYATAKRLGLSRRIGFKRVQIVIGPEDEAEFTRQYIGGDSIWSISKHFECSEHTVWATVKRWNLPSRPKGHPRRRFTEDDITAILHQWDAGISMWELRRIWRVGHVPLTELLQSHGRDTTRVLANKYVSGGYIRVKLYPDDPMFCMTYDRGYVLEHRLVMARYLGRPLERYETVHHIDGNRLNNDIKNLQLRIGKHGSGQVYQCNNCGSQDVSAVPIADPPKPKKRRQKAA